MLIKRILPALAIMIFTFGTTLSFAQKTLPSVDIKDLKGQTVNTSTLENDGNPMVVLFWATWCKPCILELNAINDVYPDWVDETGVKVIAVSVDDARSAPRVAPYVNGRGWEFDFYLDTNQDFKRAMGVNNPPHSFILNGKGEIVESHSSYAPGDEDKTYEKIQELIEEAEEEVEE